MLSVGHHQRVDTEFLYSEWKFVRRCITRICLEEIDEVLSRRALDEPLIRSKWKEEIHKIVIQRDLSEQVQVLVAQFEARVNRGGRANEQTDL